ncbi:hypothetical protein MUK42_37647 [Musa troglodytarum]|uniref:Uncharacterized protein n=1 Tax=Musa troglodytarum TaxID=320322 RepID=A0A9E7GPW3_9LILI|nr:hypothetical protein MUK42_37647 [Musa troglodytarum]
MRTFSGYHESQSIIWRKLVSWIMRKHMLTLISIFSYPNPSTKYRNLCNEKRTNRLLDL